VSNSQGQTLSVLLGNNDGTFGPASTITGEVSPIFVAVSDFNGDGNQDVAVLSAVEGNVDIRLGNGDGTFQSPVRFGANTNPLAMGVGFFSRPKWSNIVVANSGSNNISSLVNVVK
jgi:hypothetical protein